MGLNWVETKPAGETTKNWTKCLSNKDGTVLAALHAIPNTGLVPLYISADGGDTWYNRTPGIVDYIAMNDDGSIIFVACHSGESLEIYYTVDFGESWIQPLVSWGLLGEFFTDAEISGDGSKFFVGIGSTIR